MDKGIVLERLDNPSRIKATLSKNVLQTMNVQARLDMGEEITLVLKMDDREQHFTVTEAVDDIEKEIGSVLRLRTDGTAEVVFNQFEGTSTKPLTHEVEVGYEDISREVVKHFHNEKEMVRFLAAIYRDELLKSDSADLDQRKRLARIDKAPAAALLEDLMYVEKFLTQAANGREAPGGYTRFKMSESEARAVWQAFKVLRKVARMHAGPSIIVTLVRLIFGTLEPRCKKRARRIVNLLKGQEGTAITNELESFFTSHEGN